MTSIVAAILALATMLGMVGAGLIVALLGVAFAFDFAQLFFRLVCTAAVNVVRSLINAIYGIGQSIVKMVKKEFIPELGCLAGRLLDQIKDWAAKSRAARVTVDKKMMDIEPVVHHEPVADLAKKEEEPAAGLSGSPSDDPIQALEILGLAAERNLSLMELRLSYVSQVKRFNPEQFPGDRIFLEQIKAAFEAVKASKGWR